jgi:hypothetical protein
MKEVYHISGSGNNSGLKIFEADNKTSVIKIPKTLVSKSWRYLLGGLLFLLLSILSPIYLTSLFTNFYLRVVFFLVSLAFLILGTGITAIAIWEIRNAIVLTISQTELTIFQPAFFKYRSLTRTFRIEKINKLYVNKVRVVGREKYSLMLDSKDPLDERLVKGFYVPDQALWIAHKINKDLNLL